MHILTLVLSFTYSMHRSYWPFVMAEMQQMTVDRRDGRATVRFRDELYTQHLLTSFMEHASRWRHVIGEMHHYTFGYRHHDTQPESWDDACDSAAAFLDHRKMWGSVMQELLLLRLPPPLGPAFLHHRRNWLGVMTPKHRHTCLHYCVDVDARWRRFHYGATWDARLHHVTFVAIC